MGSGALEYVVHRHVALKFQDGDFVNVAFLREGAAGYRQFQLTLLPGTNRFVA
jgi:hypothetical protein